MKRIITLFFLLFLISGCGGSAGWEEGIYKKSSSYKNRCENPESLEDVSYTSDLFGSAFHEKMWLRSWSNETYLWYDEIVDQDVNLFSSVYDYFQSLKTDAVTASGNPRDRFHFSRDTEEYQQLISSGSFAGYGMRIKLNLSSPPREAVILYTEPNSPAANANLQRGAEILEIDGIDFINGTDSQTINNGLFPQSTGETHTFAVRDANSTEPRTIRLTSGVVTTYPVNNKKIIETDNGKVAYLTFNTFGTFSAEKALYDAFTELSNENVEDLVLDLRYNGGGFLDISSQLAYMIAGLDQTADKTYFKQVFNDKHTTKNPFTGEQLTSTPFRGNGAGFSVSPSKALPSLNLNRVFILSTDGTCSASEALINGLRGAGVEVILIGNTTCGKPYGFYGTNNCGTTYFTISFKGENHLGFGDYADGFSPQNSPDNIGEVIAGCDVSDDYLHLLGNTDEALLSAALQYRESGTCPEVTLSKRAKPLEQLLENTRGNLLNDPRIRDRLLMERMAIDGLIE